MRKVELTMDEEKKYKIIAFFGFDWYNNKRFIFWRLIIEKWKEF